MIRVFFASLIFVLLLASCQAARSQPYLPEGTWPDGDTKFYEEWFGKPLASMGEPVLSGGSDGTVIRLLFLPAFSPPTMVRLVRKPDGRMTFAYKIKPDGRMTLHYNITTGREGYDASRMIDPDAGIVSQEDAARVLAAVEQMGVWSGHIPLERRDPKRLCLDGTQIFLEFARAGTWVPVSRHDCDMTATDPLRKLVLLMGEIAGHPFSDRDTFR